MRISDWSSDVCSSDLSRPALASIGREKMQEAAEVPAIDLPTLQQWTETIGRAQQMMLEFRVNQAKDAQQPAAQWYMPLWAALRSPWTLDGSRIADRLAAWQSTRLNTSHDCGHIRCLQCEK